MMKSNLFRVMDLGNQEDFAKDSKVLFDLEPSVLSRLASFAYDSMDAPTRKESDKIEESAAETLGVPLSQLEHALSLARFFLKEFAPKGRAAEDDPVSVVDDMCEILKLPDGKGQSVANLLGDIKTLAQDKMNLLLLRKVQSRVALPNLSAVSTSVDFRVIFDETYEYDKNVADFSPRLVDTMPIAIVRLEISEAHNKEVFFQADRRTLQVLVDSLLALQRQMDVAEKELDSRKENA